MIAGGIHWGALLMGLVAGVLLILFINSRRVLGRLRSNGVPALATIVRIEGGASGTRSKPLMTLTLEWPLAEGGVYKTQKQKSCEIASMPLQGDTVRVLYQQGQPGLFVFANDQALRHDDLQAGVNG